MRKIFPLQNLGRSSINDERTPLNPERDRTVSTDSISTTSSTSSSGKKTSYGSFLPSYFNFFRNSLRRSASSQVCHTSVLQFIIVFVPSKVVSIILRLV